MWNSTDLFISEAKWNIKKTNITAFEKRTILKNSWVCLEEEKHQEEKINNAKEILWYE